MFNERISHDWDERYCAKEYLEISKTGSKGVLCDEFIDPVVTVNAVNECAVGSAVVHTGFDVGEKRCESI